jgi:circadian clock protein KaiC
LTGVDGLDEILHGGLIPGRFYLLDGDPGAGKTTLALQYLLAGAKLGESCLYVTLSETREELMAGAESHGWSLDGIEIVELIAEDRDLTSGDELTMYHPSEVELTETTRRVLEVVQRTNPKRMVFDSLSELRLLAQSSLRYRRQILAMKQFFSGRQCTVLLLDDRTAEGPDLQLQSIAHGVISLHHKTPAYGKALRQIKVVKFRGSDFITGLQDFSIRLGGLTVYPRLTAQEHVVNFKRDNVPSGVPALDALLGGGIDRGTATLLVGPAGTGKSTVALQFASAAAGRGDHAAVFAFEETKSLLRSRAEALGMSFTDGKGPGQIHVRQIDPAEIAPGEFAHLVRQSVERDGARVIVIDSLNGYLNAMPEDRFLMAQLHELLAYLNNQGVATFLVAAQSGMLAMGSRSLIDASYLADTVIMLRMFEISGSVKKAISVIKKRSGRHEETIRQISMDEHGLHLSEPLTYLRGVLTGVPVIANSATERTARESVPGDVI